MSNIDIVNTFGAGLILLAFFLLQIRKISAQSTIYYLMNVVGGATATFGAIIIHAWPFAVLEGAWALIALLGWLKKKNNLTIVP